MPARDGEGEEAGVPLGMPPAAQALLPFFRLGRWNTGCRGGINPEADSPLPGHQVASTLLEDVRVRQYYNRHNVGARHTPVHTGIQRAGALDQCTETTVVRRRWDKPIQVSAPGGHQTLTNRPLST